MSESPPETNPQILVNGKQQEQQQDHECLEDGVAAERDSQAKMQSVFQQVRNQIRSQVSTKAPKCSILELVQRVKDKEMEIQLSDEPEDKDVSGEDEKSAETLKDESKDELDLKEQELCAIFEKKLEASKITLKDEFDVQISQVRKEMQAYTDKALKDLECKMQSWQAHSVQQEGKGPNKVQTPSAAPSLAARRGRVLTRTMTTVLPKTCAPVIIGPRAKSETLSSWKGSSSRHLLRDPGLSLPGNKPCQGRKPLVPARPPLHQSKKPVQPRGRTGN